MSDIKLTPATDSVESVANGEQSSTTKTPYDRQQRMFFLTINNPNEKGYNHEKIIEVIHAKFKNLVYFCMCDEKGTCYHTHLYVLLSKKKRWSSVQNAFPKAHIEEKIYGSPQQCRAYIRKEGSKYKDKAETNFPETFYEEGAIPDFFVSNDRTEMLQQIDELLDSGLRPSEIMEKSIVFRQFESIIKKQYFAKRLADTPPAREISVIWHLGKSGSGKSYSYVKLCQQHGVDEVFYASDYTNNCTALLDNYEAERYLFLDEVKKDSFKFGYLLQLLQGYKTPIHARYSNVYSLYNEVHITSIFEPKELFDAMVDVRNRATDSFYQLQRRITKYVYHWKDDNVYYTYEMPAQDFISYADIERKALGKQDDFQPTEENPFK